MIRASRCNPRLVSTAVFRFIPEDCKAPPAPALYPTAPGTPRSTSTFDAPAIPVAPVAPELAIALGKTLNTRDPARLRDLLRAAGIEPDLVKKLVTAAVWRSYEARFKELQPATPGEDTKWWKDSFYTPHPPAAGPETGDRFIHS
ncbi:MAG: hypothetical protein RIQ79_1711 [Verrucomicrobiota bacterium]